jgi:hypothetical protein
MTSGAASKYHRLSLNLFARLTLATYATKNGSTTMASASKRRSIRRPVRRKERPAAAPLHALRDPIRKQEADSKRGNKSARSRGNGITPLFSGRELIELMNRRAQALAQLPIRIALSRTPFEAWRHQNQFVQGIINDCEFATLHLMKLAITPFPK